MNDTLLNEFNKAIDGLLVHDVASNTLHAHVCLVCDKFLTNTEYRTMRLKTFLKYVPYLKKVLIQLLHLFDSNTTVHL